MSQWFLKMSEYAQRLLDGHEQLKGHWPDAVIAQQQEWIGRSEGAKVLFAVRETGDPVPVFTTRPDTLWGVTFMVLAPEHPLIEKLVADTGHEERVMPAVRRMRMVSAAEREMGEREKEGVFTGFRVVNPVNGESVPLWVANFALMSYGTGAVMSVPAHDQRDFEFARKYEIPIKVVIQPEGQTLEPEAMREAYVDPGRMVRSGPFDGKHNLESMPDIVRWLEENGHGEGTINYRLRDWLISRQRYWGTPIPVVYCDHCGTVPVPEEQLPVTLPTDVAFTGSGNPLATSESFVKCTCPTCGKAARRETDTMDTFFDSSWYFLRYCDPQNDAAPFSSEPVKKWLPVNQYIGGIEHATMHLIYARFFTMVLHDLGLVDFDEPFARLFCQGMVCKTAYFCPACKWLPESEVEFDETPKKSPLKCKQCGGTEVRAEMTKISKTKLNIVDPDAMFDRFGADTVRLYMLSDAPPDRMQIWAEEGIQGAWRTVNRLWQLVTDSLEKVAPVDEAIGSHLNRKNENLRRKTHQCIQKVTEAIEGGFAFNTAIARCNELLNMVRSFKGPVNPAVLRETLETAVRILCPIVPHLSEELWARLGHDESVFTIGWPVADEEVAREKFVEIPVQINGKLRAKLNVYADMPPEMLEKEALVDERVRAYTEGKEIAKVVVVPGRMVNVVVRG